MGQFFNPRKSSRLGLFVFGLKDQTLGNVTSGEIRMRHDGVRIFDNPFFEYVDGIVVAFEIVENNGKGFVGVFDGGIDGENTAEFFLGLIKLIVAEILQGFSTCRMLLFGILMVLLMRVRPQGLLGLSQIRRELQRAAS